MKLRPSSPSGPAAAFTMVEIAICLAIIGFALVAIVGVLPSGLRVQKDNREETIINQDATYLLEAIRNGARGVDDLTNYVESVKITSQSVRVADRLPVGSPVVNAYTPTAALPYRFTNGVQIIGLLSTPKYTGLGQGQNYTSNYVFAIVRSISGPAVDKGTNQASRDFAFRYRMISEIVPSGIGELTWTNWTSRRLSDEEKVVASNNWLVTKQKLANLHEIRLIFRWPIRPNGESGAGRQVYRTLASGSILTTNFGDFSGFLFQSAAYVPAP